MLEQTLRERDVPAGAIEVIPDEQAAIDAALRMGRPGDLLLVFADALTRSWKQIIKHKPEPDIGTAAPQRAQPGPSQPWPSQARSSQPSPLQPRTSQHEMPERPSVPVAANVDEVGLEAQGFVRDERGLRFVGEAAD
jgi:cyanophycin synthetase